MLVTSDIFNSHINSVDVVLCFVNILAIVDAIKWNWRGYKEGTFRAALARVLVLLVVYFSAQLILVFTEIKPGTWSSIFRGVGPLAYYYVWAGPPREWMKNHGLISSRLENEITRIIKEKNESN